MQVEVTEVLDVKPRLFGDLIAPCSEYPSPDGSLVLSVEDAQEQGMGGPVVGYGTLTRTSTGDTRQLRNVTLPLRYQPWVGSGPLMAWHGIALWITDCDSGDDMPLEEPPRYPDTVVGSRSFARLVVGSRQRFCLYNGRGDLLQATNDVGGTHAFGFSDRAGLALLFTQSKAGTAPILHGFDSLTGEPAGTIDLSSAHPLVGQALAAAGSSKHVVWQDTGTRYHGPILGTIDARIGPDADLLHVKALVPTGETRSIPIKRLVPESMRQAIEERFPDSSLFFPDTDEHTVVEERWLAIDIIR